MRKRHANARRRFYAWERYTVRCERNGGRSTMRPGYGRAHERLLDRMMDRDLSFTGDWWK